MIKTKHIIIALILSLILLFCSSIWIKTPNKIEPEILLKNDTTLVLEYIPMKGGIFTGWRSWYDRKSTYYVTDTVGVNMWSNKPISRPFMSIKYTYNYEFDEVKMNSDTTFYRNDRSSFE